MSQKPDPDEYEEKWYKYWRERGLLSGDSRGSNGTKGDETKRLTVILPPPNITGNLHLGHALTVCIQDAIIRYKRMKGYDCLWIPGYDHAGIATHIILDKLLIKQYDKTCRDLSTAEYNEFCQKWKDDRISDIKSQLIRLGSSLDFDREFYTLDQTRCDAVKQSFIQLFNDGIIYRDKTPVNWSFFLKSTLSDIEIKWLHLSGPTKLSIPGYKEPVEFGLLHSFSYPLSNDMSGREIIVSTTRLETVVGDVAIAVHPDDNRYKDIIGRHVIHPLTGEKLPIVADDRIEKDFGTGAMKITPLNDGMDFDIAKRHSLMRKRVFDDNGCLDCPDVRAEFKSLHGMNRYDAKIKMIEILKKIGSYRGSMPHATKVPVCLRCNDVIEPMIKEQWFLKTSELNEQIEDAVSSGRIRITPDNYKKVWHHWFQQNPGDWCISRQIKWGHRIPAYEIIADGDKTGQWIVADNHNDALIQSSKVDLFKDAKMIDVKQDEDVLDTWFSSALLPFSALLNIDGKDGRRHRYPLSLMETGYDILGFWVNRMAQLCLKITGVLPFDNIILHGMICDARGKKMTKSLGNVINPLDVVRGASLRHLHELSDDYYEKGLLTKEQLEIAKSGQSKLFPDGIPKCGADALRLSLIQKNFHHQQINLSIKKISQNRHLTNKMWQTIIFLNVSMGKIKKIITHENDSSNLKMMTSCNDLRRIQHELSPVDLWILSRLSSFVVTCNRVMDDHYDDNHTNNNSGDDDVLSHQDKKNNDYMRMDQVYDGFTEFWVENMCSVYIEYIKGQFTKCLDNSIKDNQCPDDTKKSDISSIINSVNVLIHCIEICLMLMHPFTPFITEELYQRLKKIMTKSQGADHSFDGKSILDNDYPDPKDYDDWIKNYDDREHPEGLPEKLSKIIK